MYKELLSSQTLIASLHIIGISVVLFAFDILPEHLTHLFSSCNVGGIGALMLSVFHKLETSERIRKCQGCLPLLGTKEVHTYMQAD